MNVTCCIHNQWYRKNDKKVRSFNSSMIHLSLVEFQLVVASLSILVGTTTVENMPYTQVSCKQ